MLGTGKQGWAEFFSSLRRFVKSELEKSLPLKNTEDRSR
jgi:hypothetical protein